MLRRTGADPNDASCVARLGSFARLMCCIEVVLMLMTSTLDSLVQLWWAARDRTGEISASIGVGACGDAKEQPPVPITLVFQMHDWASHVLREWHEVHSVAEHAFCSDLCAATRSSFPPSPS